MNKKEQTSAQAVPERTAAEIYEYPADVKSIYDRCCANVVSFSNEDVSCLLVEIDTLAGAAQQNAELQSKLATVQDMYDAVVEQGLEDEKRANTAAQQNAELRAQIKKLEEENNKLKNEKIR